MTLLMPNCLMVPKQMLTIDAGITGETSLMVFSAGRPRGRSHQPDSGMVDGMPEMSPWTSKSLVLPKAETKAT